MEKGWKALPENQKVRCKIEGEFWSDLIRSDPIDLIRSDPILDDTK